MDNGRKSQEGGLCTYLYLIDVDVWQRPTQYCKAMILLLKINKLNKNKRKERERKKRIPEFSDLSCLCVWGPEFKYHQC